MIKIKLLNKAHGEVELENSEARVLHLKRKIHEISGIKLNLIKLIFCGKIIDDDNASVVDWHGKRVMVLTKTEETVLSEMNNEVVQMHENRQIERIGVAASIISSRNHTEDSSAISFQLMNQKGVSISLPDELRRSLMRGMILNQQGRAEIKNQNGSNLKESYEKALKFYLPAEEAYKQCGDDLLGNTDNFATLCLDIVWAMYCTQNLNDTHRISELLRVARAGFTSAHGANLERLYALKGSNCAERVLYVRLQLLEGVLKCQQKDFNGALGLLLFAQQNCRDLLVSEESVVMLKQRLENFPLLEEVTPRLAIRALRAGHSDIDQAVGYIVDRDLKERAIRSREMEEAELRRRHKRYGAVKDGAKVSIELVDSLVTAGFSEEDVVSACIEFNNNVDLVLQAVSFPDSVSVPNYQLTRQLHSMGYKSVSDVREALIRTRNDISAALDLLDAALVSSNSSCPAVAVDTPTNISATLSTGPADDAVGWEVDANISSEEDRIAAAYDEDDESHLDLDLLAEQEAIQLYLQIASAGLGSG